MKNIARHITRRLGQELDFEGIVAGRDTERQDKMAKKRGKFKGAGYRRISAHKL